MRHEPKIKTALVADQFDPMWRGACSCGWESASISQASGARKTANAHADAKNATLVSEAQDTDKTPEQVIAAVRALNTGHPDLVAVAWERGTSALSVFSGDGGTGVLRYVLSGDLSIVLVCERIRRKR